MELEQNAEAITRAAANRAIIDTLQFRVAELEKFKDRQLYNGGKK